MAHLNSLKKEAALSRLPPDGILKGRGSVISFKQTEAARSQENTQKINHLLGINVRETSRVPDPELEVEALDEVEQIEHRRKVGDYKSYESREKREARWRKLRLRGIVPDELRSHHSRSRSNKKSKMQMTEEESVGLGRSEHGMAFAKMRSRYSPSHHQAS